jgi:prefoldin subunit 5
MNNNSVVDKSKDNAYDFLNEEFEKIKKNRQEGNVFELEEVESLQILIDSNIPDAPIFPFTKDMLYSPLLQNDVPNLGVNPAPNDIPSNPLSLESNSKIDFSKLSEYPYFTNEVRYPKEKLALMEYHELVKFFFDKEEFQTVLKGLLPAKTTTSGTNHANNEYNIMTTIELLFPTVDPYKNNINTSINEYINQISYSTGTLLPTKHHTFIRHNYRIYTTTKIIWINDILNHPLYKLLIKKFSRFRKWAHIQDGKIQQASVENQDKIRKIIQKTDYNSDIERLQTYIQRLNNSQRGNETRFSTEFSFSQRETSEDLINIFQIFNTYKEYTKNNRDFSNFYNDVKQMLFRYKPKEKDNVEVKIDKYWYSAGVAKVNYENDTYSLNIFTYNRKTRNTDILVTLTGVSINKIRKPLLMSFLKKENNVQFNFEISNVTKSQPGQYQSTNKFLANYWKDTKLDLPTDSPIESLSNSPIPTSGNTTNKNTTYSYSDYHKMNIVEKNDLMKQHYRISDYFKSIETEKSVDDILNEQLETLKYIFSRDILRLQLTPNTKNNLDKCIEFYKRFDGIKKFRSEYLHDLRVDVNAKINTEFPEYLDFKEQIKKYIAPKLISVNPKLQKIIDNYANNIDSKTFINLMGLSAPCLSTATPQCDVIKNPKFIEMINTDINILNKDQSGSKYTIFLHMDFVEGQLDRALAADRGVLSKLNCMYNDALLTRQFNNLAYKRDRNTWMVQPAPFIQVEIPKEIQVPEEIQESEENRESQPAFPPFGQPLQPMNPFANVPPANVPPAYVPPTNPLPNPFFVNRPGPDEPNIVKRYEEHYVPPPAYMPPPYVPPPAYVPPRIGGKRKTLKKYRHGKRMTRHTYQS